MRAMVKFPVNRRDEHLLAQRRDKASDEIAEKIRVPQNGIRMFVGGLCRRLVGQIFR